MLDTITAIIPSFRRHENIPILIKRLQNQTHPPNRIIVWNDVAGNYPRFLKLEDRSVDVVNTNTNWWSNYGSYLIGYLTNTKYVAIIDDDMPPGPKWFEYCINKQKEQEGLYCKYGAIFNTKINYRDNEHFSSKVGNGELIEVDMVGNSYFVPYKAINCMLFQRPPTFHHTCDLHLSFCAQKYGGFKCYVPFPEIEEELPYYKPEELPYNTGDRPMWGDSNHYINRDGYVKWACKNGWKLLRFR